MCIGGSPPPPPAVPERQPMRGPDTGPNQRADLLSKRRRGIGAMILTGPSGILGIPSTGSLGGGTSG